MEWGVAFFGELERMKEKMDRVWNGLFEENIEEDKRVRQPVEKLPKFERTGRRSLRPRSQKTIRSY